jgi:hypothetical protein
VLFGAVAGQSHQRRRGEVRHVTDHSDDLVMPLGRQCNHIGAEFGDDRRNLAEGAVCGGCRRGQHPHCTFEHRSISTVEAIELAAGHRMPADKPRVVDRGGDAALDTPHVGHEPRRLGKRPLDAIDDC